MGKLLTVATRSGALAIAQTNFVVSELRKVHADLEIRIREVTTRGDSDRRTTLWQLKDSGFFTSQIEEALLAEEADFAVHSYKDLPTKQPLQLDVAAVFDRNFPEDTILTTTGASGIDDLPRGITVGTSSLRRVAQMRAMRPDLQPAPIRGNVGTRIAKLDAGDYDAIVLARAGLERLGLAGRIAFAFDPQVFVSAPAQGALAIQIRGNDAEARGVVSVLDDPSARLATDAERQILIAMQCGCHAPVGAYARVIDDEIVITAFICDPLGKNLLRRQVTGPLENALELAERIADDLLDAGGKAILEAVEKERDQHAGSD